jgi:hypothetical protein
MTDTQAEPAPEAAAADQARATAQHLSAQARRRLELTPSYERPDG